MTLTCSLVPVEPEDELTYSGSAMNPDLTYATGSQEEMMSPVFQRVWSGEADASVCPTVYWKEDDLLVRSWESQTVVEDR